jgi:hypothetical protein
MSRETDEIVEMLEREEKKKQAQFGEMYKDTYKNLNYSPVNSFKEKAKQDKGIVTLSNGQTIEIDFNSFDYGKIEEHVKDSKKFILIGENDYIHLDAIQQFKPAVPKEVDGAGNPLEGSVKDIKKHYAEIEKEEQEAREEAKKAFYDEDNPDSYHNMKDDEK